MTATSHPSTDSRDVNANGYRYRVNVHPRLLALAALLVLAAPSGLVGCSAGGQPSASPGGSTTAPDCPTAPVAVVVSVDQWGDIVSELGGQCAKVTTVLASSAIDPHDYEPAPKDAAVFEGAQLVVINGAHYDEWAAKLAASSAPDAPVISAADVSSADTPSDAAGHDHDGGDPDQDVAVNPHVWYSPAAVTAVADAVTAQLTKLAPGAADYFTQRRAEFGDALEPYDSLIKSITGTASGKTYATTEGVFDDMAAALGLVDRTPEGYRVASANETDPSPADLDAFLRLLADRGVDVLIYNIQTEGSLPERIRTAAEQAGVPVVEVTETVPPGTTSFEKWQVDQLTQLAKALGVPA